MPLLAGAGAAAFAGAAWLVIGLPFSAPRLMAELERARWPSAPTKPSPLSRASVAGLPLFAVSTGPYATPELKLTLSGVARDPHGAAALIAIGDGPAGWLSVGQTRDGATLISLDRDRAVVDTALGFREIQLANGAAIGSDRGRP